jgi:hypothetical protein
MQKIKYKGTNSIQKRTEGIFYKYHNLPLNGSITAKRWLNGVHGCSCFFQLKKGQQ